MNRNQTLTLTPNQVYQLGKIAGEQKKTIEALVSPHPTPLQHEFEDYLAVAYDAFLNGDKEDAMKKMMFTIDVYYNEYAELRTSCNKKWIHSVFLEISEDEKLTRRLFCADELSESELYEIEVERFRISEEMAVKEKKRADIAEYNKIRNAKLREAVSV